MWVIAYIRDSWNGLSMGAMHDATAASPAMAFHIENWILGLAVRTGRVPTSSEQRHSQPGSDRNPEESISPVKPPTSTSLPLRRNVHDAPFRGGGSSDKQ